MEVKEWIYFGRLKQSIQTQTLSAYDFKNTKKDDLDAFLCHQTALYPCFSSTMYKAKNLLSYRVKETRIVLSLNMGEDGEVMVYKKFPV